MQKFALIFIFIISILSCVNNADRNKSAGGNTPPPPESTSVNGGRVFKISCAICHGNDGKLGLNGSKDITKSILTLDERITLINKGKLTMPAQESILSAEEIKAVAEYSMTLK